MLPHWLLVELGLKGKSEMKGAPWSPADDERLRKLAEEGRNSVSIAERLKRTPDAVRIRANKLKITIIKRGLKAKGKT